MSVRSLKPFNRLRRILTGKHGVSPEVLVTAAQARLDRMAPAIRESVRVRLAEIALMADEPEFLKAGAGRLDDLSIQIAEVAGAAGMDAVGEAARGIVAMMEKYRADGLWRHDGLLVHMDALAVISRGDGRRDPENDEVLARLRQMRQTFGIDS